MDPTVKRVYQIMILGGIGVLLFIMALATPVVLDTSDFSMYNPGWNGCSSIAVRTNKAGRIQPTFFFEENELTLTPRSFADYDLTAPNSTILIIGPRTSFSVRESIYIEHFLEHGGMLLLADDFGTGNDLLEQINGTSRFTGELLLDLSFEKQASFVTIFDFQNRSHPITNNVSHMLLNYPTGIVAGGNTTVLAVSSEVSWLDTNGNGKEDAGEPHGPFPVLVVEEYGEGEIILFSGPSLLINSMKEYLDNSEFRDNLFRYLFTDRDTVVIDESHRDVAMVLHVFYVFPSSIGSEVKIAILLLAIGAFIVGFTRIPRFILERIRNIFFRVKEQKYEEPVERMIDELLEEHPSWSRKKLEDIMQGLK